MTKSESTKWKLAEGLKTMMLTTSYEKVNVEDVAKCAGVTRRTFYRHFNDKQELLAWIFEHEFLVPMEEQERLNTIEEVLPELCKYLSKNRSFYLKALQYKGQNSLYDYALKLLTPYLDEQIHFMFFSYQTKHLAYDHIAHYVVSLFKTWLKNENSPSAEEFSAYLIDAIKRMSQQYNGQSA